MVVLTAFTSILAAESRYRPTVENPASAPTAVPPGMVWIPGGEFSMGMADPTSGVCGGPDPMPDARPIHRVYVDGFWMDRTEVTNADFEKFVKATGYVTVAERQPRPEDFPGVPPSALVPGSVVFTPPDHPVSLNNPLAWWRYQAGANWRHPEGPGSDLKDKKLHPVVHIAYEDAVAYAKWAGKRLPTEAEWEFAARGGLTGMSYPWGDDLRPNERWMANIWQGLFPYRGTASDGYLGTAPVASYSPNRYGLYDMAGNVWEWTSDWYRPDTYEIEVRGTHGAVLLNPQGPGQSESFDPYEPGLPKRVQRGGSFLCTDLYCTRYMVGARGKGDPSTSSNHLGFRCVRNP